MHVGLVYVMSGLIAGLVLRDKTGLRYEDIKESPETSHQACQSSLSLSLSLSIRFPNGLAVHRVQCI